MSPPPLSLENELKRRRYKECPVPSCPKQIIPFTNVLKAAKTQLTAPSKFVSVFSFPVVFDSISQIMCTFIIKKKKKV